MPAVSAHCTSASTIGGSLTASKTTQVTAADKPRLTLLDGETRSASIMTTEACNLLVLSKRKFAECWADYPHIHLKLLKDLSSRVRQLTDELKCVASMDVYQRVTRLLLDLATRENETLVVTQRLTQQDIANRIGASNGGYITLDRQQIVIKKKLPKKW